jgi:hypothetical protein
MFIKVNNGIGFDHTSDKNVIIWTSSSVHIMGRSNTVPNYVKIHRFHNDKESSYETTSQYKFCIGFFSVNDNQKYYIAVLTTK